MQTTSAFIGIDVSKLTLDICLSLDNTRQHTRISNEIEAIEGFFNNIRSKGFQLYIGMENTGCYNYPLYQALEHLELNYYVISPIHLKKSLGLSRGKNDKIDAGRIAWFVEMNWKHLSAYRPARPVVKRLQLLLCVRDQRIAVKKQLRGISEQYQYLTKEDTAPLLDLDSRLADVIDDQIKAIEHQINKLVSCDDKLNACYKLITTVRGVGKVLAWNLLVRTGEFENITDPRKLACYAGVAPFEHTSGTSIRGRSRVSHYADKTLKKLLHLASMSAIRTAGDLKDYYQRKVGEGKNKMSTLNAVRNKIIHRIYAVLKRQQPYQNYLINNLAVS